MDFGGEENIGPDKTEERPCNPKGKEKMMRPEKGVARELLYIKMTKAAPAVG